MFGQRVVAHVRRMIADGDAHLLDDHEREIAEVEDLLPRSPDLRLESETPSADRGEAYWDRSFRWLRLGRLPEAMHRATGSIGPWALFHELMLRDHLAAVLERRTGDGAGFYLPHRDLLAATGIPHRTLREHMALLRGTKLLARYRAGTGRRGRDGGVYSTFVINLETISALYRYIGPRIKAWQGGLVGGSSVESGRVVYGAGAHVVEFTREELVELQRAITDAPREVDLDDIVRICGL